MIPTLVVGCGTTTIDRSKAEGFLHGAISPPPRSVRCPSGVAVRPGRTFTCQIVSASGVDYLVSLHIVDSGGRVRVSPGDVRPG